MTNNNLTKEQAIALQNAEPKAPRVYELGGDYYYRCFWLECDNTVRRYQNYCDQCGQKIDWEGVKE